MFQYLIFFKMASKEIVLSVCITCKDNKESIFKTRGGKRLSEKVLSKIKRIDNINFREVSCMSQCKRGCVFSITAELFYLRLWRYGSSRGKLCERIIKFNINLLVS